MTTGSTYWIIGLISLSNMEIQQLVDTNPAFKIVQINQKSHEKRRLRHEILDFVLIDPKNDESKR